MINAGIVGLGWWGKTLVEAVSGQSEKIRFVAGATEDVTGETHAFVAQHEIELLESFDAMLASPKVDAVVLATPNSMHVDQVVAAAANGKHVFCEKPLALTKAGAERAVEATTKAGVALAVDYNRRLHPEMTRLRERIDSGDLGVILHVESTMTFPNALMLKPDAWRANRDETPCGGLAPLGVHAVDGMIDLCGPIDEVYCQSFHRAVAIDADDTTSILFRMKEGMSGYLGTMTATGGGFNFQVYGSKGFVKLEGMTHIAGAPSEERRTKLFGRCTFQPLKGAPEIWEAATLDIVKATLEDFGTAASGGKPFMIPTDEMIHGAAVTEAIVKSAASHRVEKVI
ncbi:MAG TPA: Gfo/Idh/MocA family oxidoreductase [Gammaproteobacteria bacterium]|nr:Gfo/Idh/MocA family oxidoreductase [Gammaproteobacteria bacterium]